MKSVDSARRGSALLLAVIVFILIAGAGTALLSLTLRGHRTTLGASNGDLAFHVAEGGVDDALNKLAAYAAKPDAKSADFAVIGTSEYVDGVSANVVKGSVNRGGFLALVQPPYAGLGTYKITSVGTFSGERRAIETYVVAQNEAGAFAYGLFGDVTVDAGGSLITDGFQSGKGTYASQPKQTHTDGKTKYVNATGHIGSNGGVDVSGAALVFGNATPGPNQSVTGGGYVAGTKTSAPQAYPLEAVTYNPTIGTPSAKLPSTSLNGGEYRLDSWSMGSKDTLTIKGDVTIYVDGDIKVTAQAQVFIENGASLTVIQGSGSLDIHGGAELNSKGGIGVGSGLAADFSIKSKASSATINGGSGFIGTIYAPGADTKLNGNAEFFGSIVAKSIKPTGNAYFHYDEDLGAVSVPKIVFKVKSTRQYVP